MTIDPRTPVLVASAAVAQREEDPRAAREPSALMTDAVRSAAEHAGVGDLLRRADSVMVPRGMWSYRDPARLVAEAVGARDARTVLFEIGVLQTSLFGRAGRAIRDGQADVVLVAGGEAKYRSQQAQFAGVEVPYHEQAGAVPDEVLRPAADIVHPLEVKRGFRMAADQYAIIENALRRAEGLGVEAHRREVAEMWSAFSRVAADNPHAWRRELVSADEIAGGPGNRMLAFPYTKLHNSQWNVDQAAGLIFCAHEVARAAGVSDDRLVFLRTVVESNHMLPLVRRAQLARVPGAEIAGRRALEHAGLSLEEIGLRELYSCFPVAVRVQARELGVPLDPAPTVTGGMAFGGGPLNNFVLQAVARSAELIREGVGSHALVSAVSGILTKVGFSIWSREPAAFAFEDVSEPVEAATQRLEVTEDVDGKGEIASYTVLYGRAGPETGVAFCDLPDGRRTIATTTDPTLLDAMTREEFCARPVYLSQDGTFTD